MKMPDLTLSPYQRWLGVRCERCEDGEVDIRLPFREEFLRVSGSDSR
jgi:acyl-coenzyme A thioesterase PaaI-like protein